tara:strand:+ start:2105 stop:5425 length:3321 start_codon:yes stop_codon:yes gene_type:complete
MPASKVTKKSPKRSVEDQYRSFTPREHVLNRSGMYIGDTANVRKLSWIMTENKKMELKDITYNPGVCKLFDELITNVLDEAKRDKTLTECKITFTDESFVVENNGRGIEIVKHSGGDCYLPEFLFGKMLTSSNYDDTEEREGAGTNGIGAKAVNIFSTEFEVKIVNGGKEYTQVWRNNMAERGEPKIKSTQSSKEYVRISAKPDWAKFDMEKLSSNRTLSVLEQRAYEISALCPDKQVSVSINGKKIPVKSFEDYVNLYLGKDKKEVPRVFGEVSDWQVCVAANPYDDFVQISTVNGCHTRDGGTHVDMLVKPMCKKIGENLASKHKDLNVPGRLVEAQLMVFVNAIVPNPKFSSQSKDQLITPWRDYRGKWPLEDLFVKKVEKLGILEPLLAMARAREMKALKTPKAKRGRLTDIPKLNDANKAGQGVESQKCTLILTEGDSAKSMAISGLESKMRDYFGVFPLKGKLLNTREVTAKKLGDNAEIQAIVRILGLQFGKKYTDGTRTLRYGKIMVMTDQDDDGFHIKGLLINFIHSCWPELLEVKNFVTAMLTPIVKARKGREVLEFYNTSDYTAWKDSTRGGAGYKVKYYKGLGTSSSSEAKEYFKQMKVLDYQIKNVGDTDSLVKAFGPSKTYSDARKEWIRDSLANPLEIDYKQRHFPISRFISEELVIFANTAVRRAIPSLVDGLKPSQRKVLFGCFKRNLKSEIKVAQLAGYISEHSAYHHGEMSLNETIVGMAQNFVGAKNMNLLHPSGQFGTRIKGGKDAASPRYIFTYLSENCGKLFDRDDEVNLNYLDDDGQSIEPEYYVPVLPLALVNGFRGIATGFSTECPAFNPEELKGQLLELIKHDGDVEAAKLKSLRPWYRNFKGEIYEKSKNKWMTIGAWKKTGANSVEITELPIGTWTDDYVEFLKTMETEGNILRFDDYSSENEVKINVLFDRGVMDKFEEMEQDNEFEQYMKLTSNLSASNMHVIDAEGEIRHMNDPLEILVEFYKVRSRYYKLRYDHLLKKTKHEMSVAKSKIKFIKVVSSGNLNMTKMKRSEIVEYLRENKYYDYGEFAYLLDMRMVSMSEEKVALLNEEINKKAEFEKEMRNKVPHDLWVEDLS